jgi:hypothetical protein
MDSTLTWNITCPIAADVVTARIVEKSIYDGMSNVAGLQTVYVHKLCNQDVSKHSPYPDGRRLADTNIEANIVVSSVCNGCEKDLFNEANSTLQNIVANGSLTTSIKTNSGGTINAVIGPNVISSFNVTTNRPTAAPNKVSCYRILNAFCVVWHLMSLVPIFLKPPTKTPPPTSKVSSLSMQYQI